MLIKITKRDKKTHIFMRNIASIINNMKIYILSRYFTYFLFVAFFNPYKAQTKHFRHPLSCQYDVRTKHLKG